MLSRGKRRTIDDEERQSERTPLLSALAHAPEADLPAEIDDLLLRLGLAFGALQAGRLPTTQQSCACIRGLLESDLLALPDAPTLEPSRLSQAGIRVLLDVRKVLHALMVFLLQKNAEDALQSFVFHTRRAKPAVAPNLGRHELEGRLFCKHRTEVPDVDLPSISPQTVERDAQAFLHSLRTLFKVLASNLLSSSNSLLGDAFGVLRLILADAADEIADRSRHAADALRPSNSSSNAERPAQQDDLEREASTLKDTLVETASAFQEAGIETAGREKTFSNIAQQDYKAVILRRINHLIDTIRKQPDAERAVLTCARLVDRYLTEAEEALEAAQTIAQDTEFGAKVEDPGRHGEAALHALRGIVEGLSGQSLGPLIGRAEQFKGDVQNNEELANLVHDIRAYLERALRGQDRADAERVVSELDALYERGAKLLSREPGWRHDLDKIRQEAFSLWEQTVNDEETAALREALSELAKHLAQLSARAIWTLEGEVGDLWRDVANVMLPRLLRYVRHLSVPRTEVSTPWLDVVVDDLRLADLVLLPTLAHLTQRTDVTYERKPGQAGSVQLSTATGTLQLEGISFSCAGISLALSRKVVTWLPYLRRFSSLAEVHLPLPGLSTSLTYTRLASSWASGTSFTRLDDLAVHLSTLSVRLRNSSHPIISFVLSRMSTPLTRFILSRVLQQQLRGCYEAMDAILFKIGKDAKDQGGTLDAWFSAVAMAFSHEDTVEEDESEGDDEGDEGRPLLAGVHATRVGIVKDDPETDVAFAVGAGPQLVDGKVAGPKYDSLDAVIEDAKQATPSVPTAGSAKHQLQEGLRQAQKGKEQGAQLARSEKEWRSSAFDIVK